MRVLALFLAWVLAGALQAAQIRDARPLMGTAAEIVAEGADEVRLREGAEAAFREMRRLSDMMSHYEPSSVVSAINAAAGVRAVAVPAELAEVLAQARRVSERTGGAFDVTVGALRGWRFRPGEERVPAPQELAAQLAKVDFRKLETGAGKAFLTEPGMRIDLGGIAKLYILDAGRRVLRSHGVGRALVNGGGDVVAHSDGAPWRVGVRDPREPARLLGTLELAEGAVASSGDYERFFEREGRRYHHILDPRTGHPPRGVRGVTLVGSVEAVNGLGPALMVLGPEAARRLVASAKIEGVIVDAAGRLWMSPGLRLAR
ncbi:MAG TPA: FAD:protein FMN transferase [Burkholderiales bacterium]|nr:FAD:protein FMN transferase [Burkholderiales bacterium]